ncbi:MAG: RHS repeat-associated core domain-containing protein [Bacteroidota bacterium]
MTFTYGADFQRRKTFYNSYSFPLTSQLTKYFQPHGYEYMESNLASITPPTDVHYISCGDGINAIVVRENAGSFVYYSTYQDYLGSITVLTDDSGTIAEERNYDAWGRQRNVTDWSYNSISSNFGWLDRGFTLHEHLDVFDLINMNGRLYDPILGRMLSVDNYVPDPYLTQGYNRYTYALNNPLKYTDPDGENPILIGMLVGAAFHTASHLVTNDFTFRNWNWGQFAGSVVAGGIGGGVSSILTTAGVGGFYAGTITGGVSGFSQNLTSGLINKDLTGKSLLNSTLSGAFIGGLFQGISASIDGRNFLDGADIKYTALGTDPNLPHVKQEGTHNCSCATSEMAMRSNGINGTQEDVRKFFGGDPDKNPLPDFGVDSYLKSIAKLNAEYYGPGSPIFGDYVSKGDFINQSLRNGRAVNLSLRGTPGHSISVQGAYLKTVTRVNGVTKSGLVFRIFDPAKSTVFRNYVTNSYINNNVSTVFSYWR